MKILKEQGDVIKFRLRKSIYGEKGKILEAGSLVEIPTKDGFEKLSLHGSLTNLDPIDVPEEADYEVIAAGTYKGVSDTRFRRYESRDTVRLKKAEAIHLMLQAGKIRPIDTRVPDLSVFASFRYLPSVDPESLLTADSPEVQEKNRREDEARQAEREKGIYQAQEELAMLKKKRPFATGWKK